MESLSETRKQMRHNLLLAYKGYFFWRRLLKRYKPNKKTAIVLIPSGEQACGYYSLLYLDEYLKRKNLMQALVVSSEPAIKKMVPLLTKNVVAVAPITEKQIEYVLSYYSLFTFDKRLVVASLDKPYGRCARALIGKNGTTVEDLVTVGIYDLPTNVRVPFVKYSGIDESIIRFMAKIDSLEGEKLAKGYLF